MDKNLEKQLLSSENVFLVPPYLSSSTAEKLKNVWSSLGLDGHVFICSSGTSSGNKIKSYALSKKALMANAYAVNRFFNTSQNDVWLQSLPYYHVGGLSIIFRCLESGASRLQWDNKWNVKDFIKTLTLNPITFCSIVPTQLYDLVSDQILAPKTLKGVFVGGDFLSDELAKRAHELGWPIIRTYGMTELCSQLASSYYQDSVDGYMQVLPIHNISEDNGNFYVHSDALYTHEIILDECNVDVISPRKDGFLIPDKLEIREGKVRPLGRRESELKIKGRLYNFLDIKNSVDSYILDNGLKNKLELVLKDDEREGKKLKILALSELFEEKDRILSGINKNIPKPLHIKSIEFIQNFNRTALGKLKL